MKTFIALLLAGLPLYAQKPVPADPAPSAANATDPAASAKWLFGNWVFDEEYTRKKQDEVKREADLATAAAELVRGQLMEKLKGATLRITQNEMTMVAKDGNGKSEQFVLLAPPDQQTALLKNNKGEVTGFHLDGERIWMNSTGSVNEPFYFKRAQ